MLSPAVAQTAKDKAPAAAPAAKKDAGAAPGAKADPNAKPQSAWVKLCEKSPLVKKDKDGKETKEEKDICLTHHERLDGNSGMVLVSAAIRQVEGSDKESFMVMVPSAWPSRPASRLPSTPRISGQKPPRTRRSTKAP